MAPRRRTIMISLLALGMLATAIALIPVYRHATRARWKDVAIAQVTHQIQDPATLETQRTTALGLRSANPRFWITPDLLLMKNGDWIACRQICQKQDWRIRDLFVGRGSDGQWYYSTYHFCIGFDSLMNDPEPATLADFTSTYSLRPFDGQSDDCLQSTWP